MKPCCCSLNAAVGLHAWEVAAGPEVTRPGPGLRFKSKSDQIQSGSSHNRSKQNIFNDPKCHNV